MFRLGSFLLRVLSHLSKNHALLLAGGIAYNLLLSIVPLLTVLLVGLTHVLDRQQLLDIVRGQLVLLIPTQAQTITDQVAALIDNADVIGGIGILVLLFFSSWAFKILEGALAIIFVRSKSRRNRGFWMSALLPYIWIVVIGAGLFALTVLWDSLRRVLMVYFAKISMVSVVYGSLATVIIVLLTLEFAALIILFGAQVISEIQHSEEAGLPWYEGVPVEAVVGVRQG